MLKTRKQSRKQKRSGSTMVEFAVVAPIFFMFFVGIIDYSRANIIRNTAENAVYEGARTGIIPGATASRIQQATQNILNVVAIKNATITVSDLSNTSSQVTVTVKIPLSSNLYASSPFLSSRTIERSCTLSCENYSIEVTE